MSTLVPPPTAGAASASTLTHAEAASAVKDPDADGDLIRDIALRSDDLREAAALHPNLSEDAMVELAELSWTGGRQIHLMLAENPSVTPRVLAMLLKSPSRDVRARAARSTNATPEQLTRAATEVDVWVAAAAAGNPNTPEHMLHVLSAGNEAFLNDRLLANPASSRETLLRALPKASDGDAIDVALRSTKLTDEDLHRLADRRQKEPSYKGLVHRAREAENERVAARFGIHPSNWEALEMLTEFKWWKLEPTSRELKLTRTLFPNPSH